MDEKIILLVGDNPDDEELARIALRERNVPNQLVVARNGVTETLQQLGHYGPSLNAPPPRRAAAA